MIIQPKGVQHIGIPVSDMQRSLAFYKETLGFEPLFIAQGEGDALSEAVGVPNANLSFSFLQAGNTIVELLQYHTPIGRAQDRMNCDVGAVHIAFEVDDIEDAYKRLTAKGIKFNAPPMHIGSGPLEGCAFAYFPDPDNVQLELFQTAKKS